MLGFSSKRRAIAEHEAQGQIERIFYEAMQVLRTTGVDLVLRTWANHAEFFELMWEDLRPNLETLGFETSADHLRAQATHAAAALGRLAVPSSITLGESQLHQLRGSLELYHYLNPKLLLLTSAVRLALDGVALGADLENATAPSLQESLQVMSASTERMALGAPPAMLPMEMVDEDAGDPRIRKVFHDIHRTLSLPTLSPTCSDYRTLALWPDYLVAGWQALKPLLITDRYLHASDELQATSQLLARSLPHPVYLSRRLSRRLARRLSLSTNVDEIRDVTRRFEQMLPSLMLNIALLSLDFRDEDALALSPFPPTLRSHRPPQPDQLH